MEIINTILIVIASIIAFFFIDKNKKKQYSEKEAELLLRKQEAELNRTNVFRKIEEGMDEVSKAKANYRNIRSELDKSE